MSIAAYNRGTAHLRRQTDANQRHTAFVMMDELNALPKVAGARKPFNTVHIQAGNGGWWATCPVTGYGFWYKSLRSAVQHWDISIIGYDETTGTWVAEPNTEPA